MTKRQAKDFLRKLAKIMANSGDNEKLIWCIITALRGPDGDGDRRVAKWRTTNMIRGAILSFGGYDARNLAHAASEKYYASLGGFSTAGIRSGHFKDHIRDAQNALLYLGIVRG